MEILMTIMFALLLILGLLSWILEGDNKHLTFENRALMQLKAKQDAAIEELEAALVIARKNDQRDNKGRYTKDA